MKFLIGEISIFFPTFTFIFFSLIFVFFFCGRRRGEDFETFFERETVRIVRISLSGCVFEFS